MGCRVRQPVRSQVVRLPSGTWQTVLDTLNQSAAGNYLFGGGNTSTQPVLDANTILNGTTNIDGSPKDGLT